MKIHRCLMLLLVAVATETAVTRADGPELAPSPRAAAAPNAAIDMEGSQDSQVNASEPILGAHQFLLEVGGITPAEASPQRKRSAGSSLHRDPRAAGKAVDSDD